ncbi:hypothetical protein ONE63_000087 [Megalurothrips usitatus]|uniref:Uncharacterized protein n=1 Tax=Megalurothrips usitatus TaxID=439358 RepID=A0AAV7Y4J2_9NEOP|nr:hypothetical protein ONE63_000087 [Megalurothrips usitatus]
MTRRKRPPTMSTPSDSGVTSRSCTSLLQAASPERTAACTAAPCATASSGLMECRGSLANSSRSSARTLGMRVDPPTSTTSSTAPRSSCRQGGQSPRHTLNATAQHNFAPKICFAERRSEIEFVAQLRGTFYLAC